METPTETPPVTTGPKDTRTPDEVTDSIRGTTEKFFEGLINPPDKPLEQEKKKKTDDEKKVGDPESVETPKVDDPTQKPADPKPAEKKVDTTVPPAEEKKLDEETQRRLRDEEIARVAAEATRKTMTTMSSDKPAKTPPAKIEKDLESLADQLPEVDQEDADAYIELAQSDPKKWGNLIPDIVSFEKEANKYIQQWKSNHPGEMFNPDDEEHAEFYKDEPKRPNRRQIKQAEREITRREVLEESRQQNDERFDRLEREHAKRTVAEKSKKEVQEFEERIIEGVKESVGEKKFNQKAVTKLFKQRYSEIKPLIEAIDNLNGKAVKFDEANEVHQTIVNTANNVEDLLAGMPAASTVREDGRFFSTHHEFEQMSPPEQAKRWVVGLEEVKAFIQDGFQRVMDKDYRDWLEVWAEQMDELVKTDVDKLTQNGEDTQSQEQQVAAETPAQVASTPSIGSKTNVSGRVTEKQTKVPSPMDNFMKGLTS